MIVPASIACPQCGRVSYHPRDIAERYCGHCHEFHEDLMVKFTATLQNGRQLLGLGLTRANLMRLQQDQPIHIKLADLGDPNVSEIAIFFGEDERAIRQAIAPMIGSDTIVHTDPRLKDH